VLRILPEKETGEFRDLVAPLPQRRQRDADDVQPEEEVFAELTIGDRRFEVAVGRCHDSHVDADVVAASEPGELAVLQHLQQFRLQRRMHLADLIEEHRAVIRELELPGLLLDGAGKGPTLEPEQL